MNTPPNILLLLTDQQRFDTISATGTPHLHRLAQRGVTFDNAFCTAPVCAPSRGTLLTGRFPSAAGMPDNNSSLPESQVTIGHRLQAAGYHTVYHGKSHLRADLGRLGFETAVENQHDASTRIEAARFWRNYDWLTCKRPFFHIVSFLDPHDIYFLDPAATAPVTRPPWPNRHDPLAGKPAPQKKRQVDWPEERWQYYRQFYADRIARVDREIGETLDELFCSGFGCNTWIIFASDHGDMAGEHGLPFKGPWMYDGVWRVPLIIAPPDERWLGKNHPQVGGPAFAPFRSSALVSLADIVPTILDLAGQPADRALPGQSLLPVVRREPFTEPPAVFAEWNEDGCPVRAVRTTRWKYVRYRDHGEELYDLAADPHELTNLILTAPQDTLTTLRALLDGYPADR